MIKEFNLFDSHDVSRLHNNPNISAEAYTGAVIFQFMLPGAASIYYGDEAAVDGITGTNEGCRYPMPWSRDIRSCEAYKLYQTMAHLKRDHKALRSGGMKFLYAEGNVIAIARFWGEEVFVCVLSTEKQDVTILLPLGAVGASVPKREIFGKTLEFSKLDDTGIELKVKAHQAYLFECQMR